MGTLRYDGVDDIILAALPPDVILKFCRDAAHSGIGNSGTSRIATGFASGPMPSGPMYR